MVDYDLIIAKAGTAKAHLDRISDKAGTNLQLFLGAPLFLQPWLNNQNTPTSTSRLSACNVSSW